MNWIVDTCVILDVFEDDPEFGERSANLLEKRKSEGLEISLVTHVELAPAFAGDLVEQCRFLDQAGIHYPCLWTVKDTENAHQAWHEHVIARRKGTLPKRPLADLMIGACAASRRGLITRNVSDFKRIFPKLRILEP